MPFLNRIFEAVCMRLWDITFKLNSKPARSQRSPRGGDDKGGERCVGRTIPLRRLMMEKTPPLEEEGP